MGLDMYLEGEKRTYTEWRPEAQEHEDGFRIQSRTLSLGYWRKHPDLHGYIVQNFGPLDKNGERDDNCEPIELTANDMRQIVAAIQASKLPYTDGFFFGESSPEYDAPTIAIFEKAIEWLEGDTKEGEYREVNYRASW